MRSWTTMSNQSKEQIVDCEAADAEHDWVDAVEGPEVVGKVCAICGAERDLGGDYDDNYF
jgi:hypothetical protein